MKAGKIIEYLKQFDENKEISIVINIEVSGDSQLEDVKLYNARLAPDNKCTEPLIFNERPVRRIILD